MLFRPIKLQGFRALRKEGPLGDQGQGLLSASPWPRADARRAGTFSSPVEVGTPARPRPAGRWRSGGGPGGHRAARRPCCGTMTLSARNNVSFFTARRTVTWSSEKLTAWAVPGTWRGRRGAARRGPGRVGLHPAAAVRPSGTHASRTTPAASQHSTDRPRARARPSRRRL